MKRSIIIILAVSASLWLPSIQQQVYAEELTVETYLNLSRDRLQITRDVWARQVGKSGDKVQPPGAADLAPLMNRYGVTEEDYLAFASQHQQAIADYLAANPDINAKIKQLSSEIRLSIQRMDAAKVDTEGRP